MAGLENLFAVEPQLPNVQRTKLPENVEKWAEVITTLMREQFPDISKLPLTVEFKKKDDQTGTAIGAVHVVSPDVGKSCFVPLVIEKFQMHPLDVWMEKDTQAVHPLTLDTFKELFFVSSLSDGLDPRPADQPGQFFSDQAMWGSTYAPQGHRYAYASAGYNMLDQIADTMSAEDLEKFKDTLRQEPMLLQKFARHGHKEIIQKLAAKQGKRNQKDYAAEVRKLIPAAAVDIQRESNDKYSLLTMGEKTYDLQDQLRLNRQGCEEYLAKIIDRPKDAMGEIDRVGEKFLVVKPVTSGNVWLFDREEKSAVSVDTFGCYTVQSRTGSQFEAAVIPDVVDFSGNRISGKVVLSEVQSSYQKDVAGIPAPQSSRLKRILRPSNPAVGQRGTFIYVGAENKAIATIPVVIKSIENFDLLSVTDDHGRSFQVRRGYGSSFGREGEHGYVSEHFRDKKSLESLGFTTPRKDYFIIPSKMLWIPTEAMSDVCSTSTEWMEKTAMQRMDVDPVNVRFTGTVYEFSGAGLPKLACSPRETKLLLHNLGADHEKIAKVMERAKRRGKCSVHGTSKLESSERTKERVKEAHVKIAKACEVLRKTLIKEAAEIEDTATVDTLLALKFLNPDNLARFVSYVPVLDKAADFLAELTLSSRLGLKQINQAATAGAMTKILEVIGGLKKIEGSMKKPTTKMG
jgi:hypothetical protein